MDLSETDFDKVVTKLFDDEKNPEIITARRLVKKIAPYIGRESLELQELQDILDPNGNNPQVNQDTLKAALMKWSNSLKNGKDSCLIDEFSLFNINGGPEQYTTFSSMSSNGYKEHIMGLQNELAEKKYIIKNMKKQLELSTQVTQQHEDTLIQITMERDKLINKLALAQNNSKSCEALRKECTEQVDCLNIYKEQCTRLESTIESIKKDKCLLNIKIVEMENEKHYLMQQLSQANEEKEAIKKQLSLSYLEFEMRIAGHVDCKEIISEQEQMIHQLNTVKHTLEVDLQNSINKSVCMSRYIDESFDNSATEDLSKVLQTDTNVNIEPVKRIRCHSEGSYGKEYVMREDFFQDNQVTSTPRIQLSLLEELLQVPHSASSPSPDESNYRQPPEPLNDDKYFCSIACEAESTSDDTYHKYDKGTRVVESKANIFSNFEEGVSVSDETYMVRYVRTGVEMGTQTEVSGDSALNNNNMLVLKNKQSDGVISTQANATKKKVKKFYSGILDKFLVWGTCVCISYACLNLYTTMRYCHHIRQGTNVHVYPSEWVTFREILNSIFEIRKTGPAPI